MNVNKSKQDGLKIQGSGDEIANLDQHERPASYRTSRPAGGLKIQGSEDEIASRSIEKTSVWRKIYQI